MSDPTYKHFHLATDSDGVTTVTIDVADRPVNLFHDEVIAELEAMVAELEKDTQSRGVIFTGGKARGFFAGADVARIKAVTSGDEAEEISARGQRLFDRLEQLAMPTLAVIHGPCLGGGLEFALACRHRVARDDDSTQLGLPEVQLGILPAWGGTLRLPSVVGVRRALEMMLEGKKLTAGKAVRYGLVDRACPREGFDKCVAEFVREVCQQRQSCTAGQASRGTRREVSNAGHRRDQPAGSLSRDTHESGVRRWVMFRVARRRIARDRRHYPALAAIIEAVERGTRSREKGLAYEREALSRLLFSPTCRNLLEIFFLRERARRDGGLTNGRDELRRVGTAHQAPEAVAPVGNAHPTAPIKRIAVIGAGVMGAGIAQVAAYRGLSVVLKDLNDELLQAGLKRINTLFDQAVERGQLRREEADARRANVRATTDWSGLDKVDLVIEAVVEREDIKRPVFVDLDRHVPAGAILVSNTSALSIEHLAEATRRPGQVAGLHFFNPPHKMQLVEVVRAAGTSEATLARLVDFTRRLGKVPVVVRDSPGFLVNRVLLPYLGEALRLVGEGVPPRVIDAEIRRFGNPMGPLELLDTIGLDVAADVTRSLSLFVDNPLPAVGLLGRMVKKGWLGKKSGRGFYVYRSGRRTKPADLSEVQPVASWPARLAEKARSIGSRSDPAAAFPIRTRLVDLLINEAARCLGEGVVSEPGMVDLAMVLGTGFAPFRGGPLRLAEQLGPEHIVEELEAMRQVLGERFTPCTTLRRMSEQHGKFYAATVDRTTPSTLEAPRKADR